MVRWAGCVNEWLKYTDRWEIEGKHGGSVILQDSEVLLTDRLYTLMKHFYHDGRGVFYDNSLCLHSPVKHESTSTGAYFWTNYITVSTRGQKKQKNKTKIKQKSSCLTAEWMEQERVSYAMLPQNFSTFADFFTDFKTHLNGMNSIYLTWTRTSRVDAYCHPWLTLNGLQWVLV